MIGGVLHQGSGLGNQLARYVMTRVLALDKNLEWGMENPLNFKGWTFMNLDMGLPVNRMGMNIYMERRVNNENGVDIRDYDWNGILAIQDNTLIDGEFQGEKYYKHHKDKINKWLEVESVDMPDNLCIIGFRGGEYQCVPDLFLPIKYWYDAMDNMLKERPDMQFKVVTDDPVLARIFFPYTPVSHEIGSDWRAVRYAKYLIIANSSFYILPTWLNTNVRKVIAPRWWARHNLGFWALKQNKMEGWYYQDHNGDIALL